MFEGFFSNLSSILSNVLAIIVVIVAINILCLVVLILKGRVAVAYLIIRDQLRLTYWLLKSTAKLFVKHWEIALGLILSLFLYVAFYSALPNWMSVYTMQKQWVSMFSSIMTSATVVLLAKRKIKWLLRLVPVSTVSITTIIAIFLYTESNYLVPQISTQPIPLGLLALVLIPSIISIALVKKFYWMVKTRHQLKVEYINQEATSNYNPILDQDFADNPTENTPTTHYLKTRENRGLTNIEKAYGRKRMENSNPRRIAKNKTAVKSTLFLESEEKRTKNYVKLFPEEEWEEDADRRNYREEE